jgi:ribonuclease P protein component
MIPKKARLPRAGFRERGYRVYSTPFFSLKVKNNETGGNRIAVIVGKSVDKRAVRRNFWERRAKVQLLQAPNLGKDIIMTIFPKVSTLTRQEFIKEIKKLLTKL